jgi:N utilization substance protein B
MEGWRLSRLPRIDRDILRLAVVDLQTMKTPASVACSEAVELANRYSDEQGRRMINGVLRRLQNASSQAVS